MEQTKSQLSSLLSKERSIRTEVINMQRETLATKHQDHVVVEDDIESTPITSPENIEMTRRRLTRLRETDHKTANKIPFESSRSATNKHNSLSSTTRQNNNFFDDDVIKVTPRKVKKRSLIVPQGSVFEQDNLNMRKSMTSSQRQPTTNTHRSLSPALNRSSSNSRFASHQPRHEPSHAAYEVRFESAESVFELDLQLCQEAESRIASRIARINCCLSHDALMAEFCGVSGDLLRMGVVEAQLWLVDPSNGALWTTSSARQTTVLNAGQYEHVLNLSRENLSMVASSSNSGSLFSGAGNVFTVRSPAAEVDYTSSANPPLQSSARRTSLFADIVGMMQSALGYDSAADRSWSAVHALTLPVPSAGPWDPELPPLSGVVFVAASTAASLPFHSAYGSKQQNQSNLRRFILLQLVQRARDAVAQRMDLLRVSDRQQELQQINSYSSEICASKTALLTCAQQLGSAKSAKDVLSVVTRTGLICDHYSTAKCWLVMQQQQTNTSNRNNRVCVVTGSSSQHSAAEVKDVPTTKLLSSLLSGHTTLSGAGLLGEVTESELNDAGMRIAPSNSPPYVQHTDDHVSLLYLPVQFALIESVSESVASGAVQGSLVIALSAEADQDLLLSHASTLAEMMKNAFAKLAADWERSQQDRMQQLSRLVRDSGAQQKTDNGAEASLIALLNTVQSQQVGDLLGVRRSLLIASSGLLADSDNGVSTASSLSFVRSNGSALVSVSHVVDTGASAWMQDLNRGKIVFCSLQSSSAAPFSVTGSHNSGRNQILFDGSVQSSNEHMGISQSDLTRGDLQMFITAIDPSAQHAMLVPIRTEAGMSVLVLLDNLSGSVKPGTSLSTIPNKGQQSVFSVQFVESLIASDVCSDLRLCLSQCSRDASAEWRVAELQRRLLATENLVQQKEKTASFQQWRSAVEKKKVSMAEEKSALMLNTVLRLVNSCQEQQTSVSDHLRSYLDILQEQLNALFPSDAVVVDAQQIVRGGEAVDSLRSFLFGEVRDHHSTTELNLKERSSGGRSRVVGWVKLTRAHKTQAPFSREEEVALEKVCVAASEVYTALRRGLNRDLADGDVRSLLLPMLVQLLPGLLSAGLSGDAHQDFTEQLPLIINWVKRLCGADLAVCRLRPLASGPQQTGDHLVSSQDTDGRALHAIEKSLPQLRDQMRSTASGSESSEGQLVVKLPDLASDQWLGEIKIISNHVEVAAEQRAAAELVSFVLSFALSSAKLVASKNAAEAQAQTQITQLESALHSLQRDMRAEQVSGAQLKSRLASLLSLVVLLSKLPQSVSVDSLAAQVSDALPHMVGGSSAVLLMASPDNASEFTVFLPTGRDATGNSVLSRAQLSQVPSYFSSPNAAKSKIELTRPTDGTVFGFLLVFRPQDSVKEEPHSLWHGLEDLFSISLSTVLFDCAEKFFLQTQHSELKNTLYDREQSMASFRQLETDLAAALDIRHSLEKQRDSLLQEVAERKQRLETLLEEHGLQMRSRDAEVEQLRAKKEAVAERLGERIKSLENELQVEGAELAEISTAKSHLLKLLTSFSFDQRCQRDSVVQWLSDVAEDKEVAMLMVAQSGSGALTGGEGIRGILSAVSESIRTGNTVALTTSYNNNANDHSHAVGMSSMELRNSKSFGQSHTALKYDAKSGSNGSIEVLCVPNRCIPAGAASEHACFVFVKSGTSESLPAKFSVDDSEVLSCAVNLTCRALMKVVVKYSSEDFRQAELAVQREQLMLQEVRRATALGERVRLKNFQSRADVQQAVEQGMVELLRRADEDPCVVECRAMFPPYFDQTMASFFGHNVESECVAKVTTSGRSLRKGGIMWTPLLNRKEEVIAVLRSERRINTGAALDGDEHTSMQSAVQLRHSEDVTASVSDIMMTETDQEAAALLGSLVAPLLDRVEFISEALDGVKQAGQAIMALQRAKASVDDRCAGELAARLQLEEAMRVGAEMLGSTCSHRVSAGQLLDAARKAVTTITSAADCFVIMPHDSWSDFDDHVHLDDQDALEAGSFFALEADRPRAIKVSFETGDVEHNAMVSFKSVLAGPEGHDPSRAEGIARPWQSWAVRRVQGQSTFRAGGVQSVESDLFAIATPISLRSGSKAVITTTRMSAQFSSTDRECISWIGRVLAYCLEMRGGEGAVLGLQTTVKELRGEVLRLNEEEGRRVALESDCDALQTDLREAETFVCPDTAASSCDGKSIIAQTAKVVFGDSAAVEAWTAEEAVQTFGVLLPTESFFSEGRAVTKDSLIFESGKLTYWVDSNGEERAGLDFFKAHNQTAVTVNKPVATTKLESKPLSVLYVICQVKGFAVTWLKVSSRRLLLRNCKLRLSHFLKLLESQEVWRAKLIAMTEQNKQTQLAAQRSEAKFAEQLELQESAHEVLVGEMQIQHVSAAEEEARLSRLAERVLVGAMVGCTALTQHLQNDEYFDDSREQALLVGLCRSMEDCFEGSSAISFGWVPDSAGHQMESAHTHKEAAHSVTWLHSSLAAVGAKTASQFDPVSLALASGKVVVFLGHSVDSAATREQLVRLSLQVASARAVDSDLLLCVAATESFPSGTLVVPLTHRSGAASVLVIPPTGSKSNKPVTSNLLYSSVAAWLSIKFNVQDTFSARATQLKVSALVSRASRLSLKRTLQLTQQLTATSEQSRVLVFERLKYLRLQSKLEAASVFEPKFRAAAAQVRILEQLSADWTEAVKGINGACAAGLTNGISGLWAQSCSTLISMVSSHLSLTGCGLIMQASRNGEGAAELVEYSVREVTTPVHPTVPHLDGDRDEGTAARELADYARGVLELRPASDLGQKVQGLVSDILAGRAGTQRIFKLTRPKLHHTTNNYRSDALNEEGENLWLVPIKTARNVLAVLRVSVEIPRDGHSTPNRPPRNVSFDESFAQSVDLESSRVADDRLELSSELLVQTAQSNLINFAEVLAPVFAATARLDRHKVSHEALDASLGKLGLQHRVAVEQMAEMQRCAGLLSSALGVTQRLVVATAASPNRESVHDTMSALCSQMSSALSEILDGHCVVKVYRDITGPTVDIFAGKMSGGAVVSERSAAEAVTVPLLDSTNKSFGSISLSRKEPKDDIQSLRESASHAKETQHLLKSLSFALAGMLSVFAREAAVKIKASALTQEVQEVERTLRSEQEALDIAKEKETEMGTVCEFYRGLADVVNQCLIVTTQKQHPDALSLAASPQLLELLRVLTGRLPALIGNACLFNFAVVDSLALDSNTAKRDGAKMLHWVYGGGEGDTFSSAAADYLKVNEGVREVSNNLVHSCILKRSKSSFDIGTPSAASLNESFALHSAHPPLSGGTFRARYSSVRILTFPLLNTSSPFEALGVMQVLLDLSADRGEVNSLCEDIANAIACAVSHTVHQQELLRQIVGLELRSIEQESRLAEDQALKAVWQQRCSAWRGVAELSCTLAEKGCTSAESLVVAVQSTGFSSLLVNSGVNVSVRAVRSDPAQIVGSAVISSALVPITKSDELVVEVVDDGQHSVNGLAAVANDIVSTAARMVRAVVAIGQSSRKELAQTEKVQTSASHKVEKLQSSLRVAREELSATAAMREEIAQSLRQQVQRYDKLRAQASSSVTSLCLPAIAEITALLQEVHFQQDSGSSPHWVWAGLAKVADRAVSRISNDSFPFHVSVVVNANSTGAGREAKSLDVKNSSLVMYEATRSGEGTVFNMVSAADGSVSALERCLTSGGVQEVSGSQLHPADLSGISHSALMAVFGRERADRDLTVLCISLHNSLVGVVAVVRLVFQNDSQGRESLETKSDDRSPLAAENLSFSLLRPVLEMVTTLGGSLLQLSSQQQKRASAASGAQLDLEEERVRTEQINATLSKVRRMQRVVCREASGVLLDPPIVGGSSSRAVHPANLTPLAASQDTCLKLLGMIRTLLRSEGQAVLLQDSTTDPLTYQVMYTGDGLHWPGIDQGTFGLVSSGRSGSKTSLTESAMNTRKSVQTADAPSDARYCSYLDGICSVGTPVLTVPLRGRGGTVVGALVVAKSRGAGSFSAEDIAAAEMTSTFGSLALYWCQGLGSLHHQLHSNVTKMDSLERMVKKIASTARHANIE